MPKRERERRHGVCLVPTSYGGDLMGLDDWIVLLYTCCRCYGYIKVVLFVVVWGTVTAGEWVMSS